MATKKSPRGITANDAKKDAEIKTKGKKHRSRNGGSGEGSVTSGNRGGSGHGTGSGGYGGSNGGR